MDATSQLRSNYSRQILERREKAIWHQLSRLLSKRSRLCRKPVDNDAPARRRPDTASALAAAVSAKIEHGNIRAAVRIVCSEEKPAPDNSETLAKLLESTQSPPPVTSIPGRLSPSNHPKQTSSGRSDPSQLGGSCGGLDRIRPKHIADMVNCRESDSTVLSAITTFVNCLLDGKCLTAVKPILFGGNLIALEKKSGGIGSVAVGYVWRRCQMREYHRSIATCLLPQPDPTGSRRTGWV